MFIKFVDIDCFLCNSYPCVLFESLSHMINQESHVYSWNLAKIYLVHFLKFWNLPLFTRENSKKVNSVNLSRISLLNMWLLYKLIFVVWGVIFKVIAAVIWKVRMLWPLKWENTLQKQPPKRVLQICVWQLLLKSFKDVIESNFQSSLNERLNSFQGFLSQLC